MARKYTMSDAARAQRRAAGQRSADKRSIKAVEKAMKLNPRDMTENELRKEVSRLGDIARGRYKTLKGSSSQIAKDAIERYRRDLGKEKTHAYKKDTRAELQKKFGELRNWLKGRSTTLTGIEAIEKQRSKFSGNKDEFWDIYDWARSQAASRGMNNWQVGSSKDDYLKYQVRELIQEGFGDEKSVAEIKEDIAREMDLLQTNPAESRFAKRTSIFM